jgi:hypothetical protein
VSCLWAPDNTRRDTSTIRPKASPPRRKRHRQSGFVQETSGVSCIGPTLWAAIMIPRTLDLTETHQLRPQSQCGPPIKDRGDKPPSVSGVIGTKTCAGLLPGLLLLHLVNSLCRCRGWASIMTPPDETFGTGARGRRRSHHACLTCRSVAPVLMPPCPAEPVPLTFSTMQEKKGSLSRREARLLELRPPQADVFLSARSQVGSKRPIGMSCPPRKGRCAPLTRPQTGRRRDWRTLKRNWISS